MGNIWLMRVNGLLNGFACGMRWVYPNFVENPNLKWMIWGYPYFRKPPCGILQLSTGRSVVSLRPFSKNIFDIEDAMGPHENCHFRANEITQNNIEQGGG